MNTFGLLRVAAACPRVSVANVRANVASTVQLIQQAVGRQCQILVFPELSLTGYTCADLFQQSTLLDSALVGLQAVRAATQAAASDMLVVVGLPIHANGRLYNAAAVVWKGRILGVIPKSYIPNYKEYYERRWFSPATGAEPATVRIGAEEIPFGVDLLFVAEAQPQVVVGVEICEDLWVPIPPSCRQCLAGANVLLNPSASVENTGKAEYRRDLVVNQSGRCIAAYVYSASGVTESTTDLVFGGHAIIAEDGRLLGEAPRFQREPTILIRDVDIERIQADRLRMTTFAITQPASAFRRIPFGLAEAKPRQSLERPVPAHPFVPDDEHRLAERCEEIFQTQTAGLAKRLEVVQPPAVHLGISGGLDSTLALLVTARAADLLGWDRHRIRALTMPGFGTSSQTRANANRLMQLMQVGSEDVDIRQLCLDVFQTLGHRPFGIDVVGKSIVEIQTALGAVPAVERNDLVFENVQARVRTMLLMNRGFVIGTGDLSELALGWCTYNADHMSMYNPNVSIPKTLVRFLVRWAADHEFAGELRSVLHSIADTVISPELLPLGEHGIQSTEATVGPYELHDFFLFHVLRFGFGPSKILYLANEAQFTGRYSSEEIRRWLRVFYQRFFAQQFKRSCLPDGPKVGSVSVSPRGDWRMPSDADAAAWLDEVDAAE